LLAAHLHIDHVELLIGSSLGGFQCMEWAIADPDFARNVALIATAPDTTPWAAAFNESQRMAIEADHTFGEPRDDAGAAGMACARSIALLSYRGATAYNLTQPDMSPRTNVLFKRRVHSYQQHQGTKMCNRFNAYSYYRLTQAIDSQDIARGRGNYKDVLRAFKPRALVVAITSDILFPPEDHQPFIDYIPNVTYHLIDSSYGHDGFLIEHEKLDKIIKDFLSKQ
jgi:homoserine O-acetyltransferase